MPLDNALNDPARVQVHGGTGYIRESEIKQLYGVGKLMEMGVGSNQIRQVIIAQELLK